MAKRQRPHHRTSKRGKKFVAGQGKRRIAKRANCTPGDLSNKEKKQVVNEAMSQYMTELKMLGRTRIPDVGILRVVKTKAKPARKGRNPFTGEEMMFKAKPAGKKIKFRAMKALKEAI